MAWTRNVMVFPLLLALLISSTNAIPEDAINDLCSETQDKDFCLKHIGTDPRTKAAANLNGVLLVAISQATNQVIDGSTHIDAIKGGVSDALGQKRIGVCDSDYENAHTKFQEAWGKANEGAFMEVINFVRDGTNAVIDCINVYRRDGPTTDNPLGYFNQNVFKLSEIILVVNNKLIG
ncbi:PREDICTED: uncharacterized protein LOC104826194 [Tarenaya hassleriana]|uniref:uncharacterized protein LOC104826194 n=1 Tax=Tarenaya hassleriana TaxID=28532 RepID=UPI00053C40C9|nr:PREDICTED: uncharacterized protein LOC104826194 [Tarenaya hassleriana]